MKKEDCIFCKIANGEIPSTTVYEDEMFRVILDLGPASRGHALILPKEHFKDVCELDEKTAAKILPLGGKDWCRHENGFGLHRFQPGSEQWNISRADGIPFSYAYYSAL